MLVPDAAAHAPHEQRFTDIWRATCYRSAEACSGQPQLQSATQLCRTTSRLRLFRVISCFELKRCTIAAAHHSPLLVHRGALRRRYHHMSGKLDEFVFSNDHQCHSRSSRCRGHARSASAGRGGAQGSGSRPRFACSRLAGWLPSGWWCGVAPYGCPEGLRGGPGGTMPASRCD